MDTRDTTISAKEIRILALCPAKDINAPLEAQFVIRELGRRDEYIEAKPSLPTLTYTNEHGIAVGIQSAAPTASHQADKDPQSTSRAKEISKAKPYAALSYTWGGEPDPACHIKILQDEQAYEISITANLKSALRHLRLSQEVLYLWVDALCINQKDLAEKGSQVPRMAYIYNEAAKVLVWLGEENDDSRFAMNFMRRFSNSGFFSLTTPTEDEAFLKLIKRPWFSRRWIVQEIVFAREAHLRCGSEAVTWRNFVEVLEYYRHRFPDRIKDLNANRLVRASEDMVQKSDDGTIMRRNLSLEALMSSLTDFEASVPHDTIYAVLCLAKDVVPFAEMPPSLDEHRVNYYPQQVRGEPTMTDSGTARLNGRKNFFSNASHLPIPAILNTRQAVGRSIIVDYSKTVLEVYKDLLAFVIARSSSLDIICRPLARDADPDKKQQLPSWIPRLSAAPYEFVHDRYERVNADLLVGMPHHQTYKASGSSEPISPFREDFPSSFFVCGFILDKIGFIGTTAIKGNVPADWLEMIPWNHKTDDIPDKLWKTLTANVGLDGRKADKVFQLAISLILKEQGQRGNQIITQADDEWTAPYLKRVQSVVWERSLILTQSQLIPGLAPSKAQEEDLVCILNGCSVPVILRKTGLRSDQNSSDHYYEFIGECYVHGMMDGEAMQQNIVEQIFELR